MSHFPKYANPFGDAATSNRLTGVVFKIGDVDVTSAVVDSSFHRRMNQVPSAEIRLSPAYPFILNIDWRAGVHVSRGHGENAQPVFGGDILSVEVVENNLFVRCTGVASFEEVQLGGYAYRGRNVPTELVYATARDAGLRENEISITATKKPLEVYEVVIPLRGIQAPMTTLQIGQVSIHGGAIRGRAETLLGKSAIVQRYAEVGVYAVVYTSAVHMHEAEQQAIIEVESMLEWLAVRTRYSLATLPDGTNPDWFRGTTLSKIRRDSLTLVRGILTGGVWLRDTTSRRFAPDIALEDTKLGLLKPSPGYHLLENLRHAISACARAGREIDPINRITAIWDAVEFYAGKTSIQRFFTSRELKSIRRAFPDDLSRQQRERLNQILEQVNMPPLLARFRRQIAVDGVPLTESEFNKFANLRKIRNDLVHGRLQHAGSVDTEDIERCLALLARILMFAVANANRSDNAYRDM
ncbi:hypothetical protein [Kibdelosporangium aridum]|uniref:Uncharacterized protein n=1 Tax=Kibdelosporangium aridum TaxID=2030 RepID=A0A1W2CL54_KIBAR|nr:hypothetical protein [Kibdelosporangium aridum]SMC85388.1 hypothetical protein SAMN05661093_02193 [Kibdelosporangium aridum]